MNVRELQRSFENCPCGRRHLCPIDNVAIGSGILGDMISLCADYNNILLVSDNNTYAAAGKAVYDIIGSKVYKNLILSDNADVVVPNEEKIDEIDSYITSDTDLIIGVGSGVINDLCKYTSFKKDIPYFIVATAPSMDGYASVGAALILGGMKVTLNARPPKAIIADTSVLKNAPLDMIRAGYGDIIGKFSCLNDWKLSALINGEYFCDKVYDMTYASAKQIEKLAEGISARDEKTVGVLMEALVNVGVAMSFVDCSRPASGSEHHLSHFFEITGLLDGKEYFAHGIDVVFSSVVTARIRREILAKTPSKRPFDRKKWEGNIRRIYSTSADGIVALQDKLGWYEKDDCSAVYEKWEEIKKVLADSPSPEEFIGMISAAGLDYSEFEKMYGKDKIYDAVLYAKDLKDRYSVLWLYYSYFA
ncbi:MAG: sn-glycerol-1-phosphate dehydrogenase [Clostridia bacterium]|nr:sn-glycerol-1-phosphate dehydrogenase [Clostridia bacterium]